MDSQRILRIPQAGSPDDFVLVSVSRVGPSELDLKLVATEGEYPYVGSGTKPLLPLCYRRLDLVSFSVSCPETLG